MVRKERIIAAVVQKKQVDVDIFPATRFVFEEPQELSDYNDDDVWNMLANDSDSFLSDDGWDNEPSTTKPTKPTVGCPEETPNLIIEQKQTDWDTLTSTHCVDHAKPKVAVTEYLFLTIDLNFLVLHETHTASAQLSHSFSKDNLPKVDRWLQVDCLRIETQILRAGSILGVPNLQMVSYLMSLPQIESLIFVEVVPKKKQQTLIGFFFAPNG